MNDLPPSRDCPALETLRQLLLGKSTGSERDALEQHVDHCDHCADRIARLDTEDGLLTFLSGNSDVNRETSQTLADERSSDVLNSPSVEGDTGRLGPYRILNELGRGGMGVVYAAEDSRLRRRVALKVMHAVAATSTHYQVRFEREVDALAKLSHPNIVRVYEAGRHKALPYLVMEFVPGGTLAGYLNGQPQPPLAAAELTATLAEAVHFAHQKGVVHRDLKPSNILLTQTSTDPGDTPILLAGGVNRNPIFRLPKIADFGLARHVEQEALTQSGDLLGTPGYMAPEMTRGGNEGSKDSPAVDVYGLGAILYEMLTGRPPFRGETVPDTFEQVRHMDPVPVRQLQPKIPRDLEIICLKCLQKSQAKRYRSAAELGEDLHRFLTGRTIHARPAGVVERLTKWVRRKPAWAAATAVLLLAAIALLGTGVQYERRLRLSRDAAERSAEEARRERENAHAAKDEADKSADTARRERENALASYREARGALEKILSRATHPRRGDLPRVRELRQEQQQDALAFYLRMAEQRTGTNAEVRFDAAQARLQAGLLQMQLGRPELTENLQQAAELLRTILVEKPDEPRYRRAYAECLFQQAVMQTSVKKKELLEVAIRELESILEATPKDQGVLSDLARANNAMAQYYQAGKFNRDAEKYYRRAIEIRQGMLKESPNWRDQQVALGQNRVNLLLLLQNSKHTFAELEPEATALAADLERLNAEDPNDAETLISLATLRLNWSYMLINEGRSDECLKGLGEVIEALEAFLVREPNWSPARHALYSARGTRAIVFDRKGRYADAARDYRRVVDLAPNPQVRKSLRSELGNLLVLARDYAECMLEVERSAAETVHIDSSLVLQRQLRTCAALAEVSIWKLRPYRTRAIEAARKELENARGKIDREQWGKWMKSLGGVMELNEFLKQPMLAAYLK